MPLKSMDEARHLVVEKPDGSVAIAFNEDVPPPEVPPEPPATQRRIHITGLTMYIFLHKYIHVNMVF